MTNSIQADQKRFQLEEHPAPSINGMLVLLLNSLLILAAIAVFILAVTPAADTWAFSLRIIIIVLTSLLGFIVGPILYIGLKILKPNEALVLTLFGRYYGTLRGEGFYYVNPFVSAVNPAAKSEGTPAVPVQTGHGSSVSISIPNKKLTLKAMTLNNEKQKVNDALGNPIIIGIVVIWKVVNTAKAVFNVDNFKEFLSIQCDSALRNIVREFPYDASDDEGEKSLRGSSLEVAAKLKEEIQGKVEIAGLEIL